MVSGFTVDREQQLIDTALAKVRARQDMRRAFNAGSAAATVTAAAWGVATYAGVQSQLMAVLVGVSVGWAVRVFGRGLSMRYGFLAGALALYGCMLGNVFASLAVTADRDHVSMPWILAHMSEYNITGVILNWVDPFSLMLYGFAIYFAFLRGYREPMVAALDYLRDEHEHDGAA